MRIVSNAYIPKLARSTAPKSNYLASILGVMMVALVGAYFAFEGWILLAVQRGRCWLQPKAHAKPSAKSAHVVFQVVVARESEPPSVIFCVIMAVSSQVAI